MSAAMDLHKDQEPGRWVVETFHRSRPWEVIVEPDPEASLLVVITAYALETP